MGSSRLVRPSRMPGARTNEKLEWECQINESGAWRTRLVTDSNSGTIRERGSNILGGIKREKMRGNTEGSMGFKRGRLLGLDRSQTQCRKRFSAPANMASFLLYSVVLLWRIIGDATPVDSDGLNSSMNETREVVQKPGFCNYYMPGLPTGFKQPVDFMPNRCLDDGYCADDLKCCPIDDYIWDCSSPVAQEVTEKIPRQEPLAVASPIREGYCPDGMEDVLNPFSSPEVIDRRGCTFDVSCPGNQKCCPDKDRVWRCVAPAAAKVTQIPADLLVPQCPVLNLTLPQEDCNLFGGEAFQACTKNEDCVIPYRRCCRVESCGGGLYCLIPLDDPMALVAH
ncbi:unnamed protein product [Darwinula stevensoni]|uniref:WAP domain-containing protein n=1 Tax=Darwinula stevensoni TaxID=69355 RepID=A0A7R9AEZ2_9CRUS|nr:unnamed protein product [Darwinula stevensoni]CAG0902523.1 unnamed protein product [Darwinula stevensoni]